MSLQYIIDGYNIINHPSFIRKHKHSVSPRVALLTFIRERRLTGSPKNKVIVVFDGYPAGDVAAIGSVESSAMGAVFSRKISADEKIKKLVEESLRRKNMVVVSDDRELGFMVKSLGSRWLGVEDFIAQGEKSAAAVQKGAEADELTYSQKGEINKELRKIWLE